MNSQLTSDKLTVVVDPFLVGGYRLVPALAAADGGVDPM